MTVPPTVPPTVPLSVPPTLQSWLVKYGEPTLKLRGRTWQIRVLKPKELRRNQNDKYFSKTSATDSKALAESLKFKIAVIMYRQLDDLYAERNKPEPNKDKFKDLARLILANHEPPVDMDRIFKEQEWMMVEDGLKNVKTDQGEIANFIIALTGDLPDELIKYMDEDERNEMIYVARRIEFDRKQARLLLNKDDLSREIDGLPGEGMDGFVKAGHNAFKSQYKLSTLITRYLESKHWNRSKTKSEAKLALERFLSCVGDVDLPDLSPKDAYTFAHWMVNELDSANASVKNAVSYVSGLLTWAITVPELEACTVNNFNVNGNLILKDFGKVGESYQPFSTQQLKEIFQVDANARELLCLSMLITSGCRLDEISSLEWTNVKTHDEGFQYIDTTFGLVKNCGSERYIPIPTAMAKLMPPRGFTFDKDKLETRIFNYSLDADMKSSRASSQACIRVLHKIPTKGKGRQVTHSLRGNLKDMLRDVGCPKEVNDFITGHGEGDVASKYGVGPSVSVRHEWLEKIHFDFLPSEIDYSKIPQSNK